MYKQLPEDFFAVESFDKPAPLGIEKEQPKIDLIHPAAYSLNNYSIITLDNAETNINVTTKEVLKNIFPVIISYGIGGAATIGYIGVSFNAADGDIAWGYVYVTGSLVLNFLVNGYFFHDVVSSVWNEIFTHKKETVHEAFNDLKNLRPGKFAKFLRACKSGTTFFLVLAPAFASAFPFYQIDQTQSDHSKFVSTVVLLSATALQYKGVEALFFEAIPTLFSPFKALYRKLNDDAMKAHKIRTTISLLKDAHKDALGAAREEILRLMQIGDTDLLQELYGLLNKPNKTKEDAIQLLLKTLEFAKINNFQASPVGRLLTQIISLLLTAVSLPGYFIVTEQGIADYLKLNDATEEWLIGSAIFLVTVALSFRVGWVAGGDLYDLFAYSVNGIKNAWQQSASFTDFFKKAWQSKDDLGSWYNLLKLPLPIQQNPRIMLSLIVFLYVFSYYSTQPSTYLNEVTLGKEIAQYLKLPTIIAVMIFNAFPVDKVLGSVQQFLTRLLGSEESKKEIQLERYIQNQINLVGELDDDKFSEVLKDIVKHKQLPPEKIESTLMTFFGNKTPKAIFGENRKSRWPFREIIPRLIKERVNELSHYSDFFKKSQEKQKLIINDESHGTFKMTNPRRFH